MYSSEDEEIKKKKKNKKRIPKLPNKVVVIKNIEKDKGNWMEQRQVRKQSLTVGLLLGSAPKSKYQYM